MELCDNKRVIAKELSFNSLSILLRLDSTKGERPSAYFLSSCRKRAVSIWCDNVSKGHPITVFQAR